MESENYVYLLSGISIVTIGIQAFVLYLVQFHSPKSMSDYRFFLNTFTLYDMVLSVSVGIFMLPLGVPYMFASWSMGLSRYFRPSIQLFWLSASFYAGTMIVQSQIYSMIYRYTSVHPNKNLHKKFMSKSSKIGFAVVQQILGITIGVLSYFACVQPDEFDARFKLEPIEVQEAYGSRGFFIWFDVENNVISLIFFGTMISYLALLQTICVILIYRILAILKVNSNKFSKTTLKLHRQLTILLAVQLATPLLFVVPVTACVITNIIFRKFPEKRKFIVPKTRYYQPWMVKVGFSLIDLYAGSNALFTVFFISPYRAHLFGLLGLKKLQSQSVMILATTRINPTVQTRTFNTNKVTALAARNLNQRY